MIGLSSAAKYAARAKDAIKDNNWEALESNVERLKQIFLDAVVFGRRDVAVFIGKAISEARNELWSRERISTERTAESMYWTLASDNATCLTGLRLFRPEAGAEEAAPENVEQQILRLLSESSEPLGTGPLTDKIGCAQVTTSRALSVLRDKGVIRTVPVGRARLHYLTRRGQMDVIGKQAGELQPIDLLLAKSDFPKSFITHFEFDGTIRPGPGGAVPSERLLNEGPPAETAYSNDPCSEARFYSTAEKIPARAAIG